MPDIPTLSVFGHRLTDPHGWLYLIWAVLLACVWLARNLLDSRHGRAIRALATGRAMADSLGIDTAGLSRTVFVLAALAAGLSGWLFAHYQLFINPSPFSLDAGIEYLFMVIVGGLAWLWGAVLGAGVVVVLRDQLNDLLPRLIGQPGNYETIVFAIAVILILQRAPAGLWPLLRRIAAPAPPARPAAAERLPRRAPSAAGSAPALELLGITRRFGGLGCRQRDRLRRAPRRDRGADRPQRRRQDDGVQPGQRCASPRRRAASASSARRRPAGRPATSRGAGSRARSSTCACCPSAACWRTSRWVPTSAATPDCSRRCCGWIAPRSGGCSPRRRGRRRASD